LSPDAEYSRRAFDRRRRLYDLELAWTRFWRRPVGTLIGTWAVVVAVAAVTFVLSLGDGLSEYLSQRLQALTPPLWVEAPTPPPDDAASDPFARKILAQPGVLSASPHVSFPVLVSTGRHAYPARLEGYDPEVLGNVLPGLRRALQGRAPTQRREAVLGSELAVQLGVAIGDALSVTPAGGEALSLTVVGLIHAGISSVDGQLIIADWQTAASAAGPGAKWGYAVGAEPGADLAALRLAIQQATQAWVQPWYEGKSSLLEALAVERQVMLWISLAAVATAAFATASVTALRAMEQRYELAILQAVGAGFANTVRLVLAESLTSAFTGALLGALLGWAGGWALSRHPLPLPPQFGLAYLPVRPSLAHALLGVALTLLSTTLASVGPALKAAKLDPAELLRKE